MLGKKSPKEFFRRGKEKGSENYTEGIDSFRNMHVMYGWTGGDHVPDMGPPKWFVLTGKTAFSAATGVESDPYL